jgi:alpha-aminoadipic semialdehyde synthase
MLLQIKKFSTARLSIGIRREGKNRWERRVPLLPDQVERLTKELNCTVFLQPSTKRVIPDDKFVEAGAIVTNDLSKADIILGVKEVPIDELIPNKTFMFFSHTHKGQPYNMKMLKTITERNIRLLDYELLTNDEGARLVQFSRFAGYAGMIDGLHSLGLRLLAIGYGNPFLAIGMSYMYRCLADARLDVTRTGMVISDDGLPKQLGPMIFVITGNGNVSKGALHVFKCLPYEWVKPSELEALSKSKTFDNHKVYLCQVTAKDYCINEDGTFDETEYFSHPERYTSVFHKKIAPYASLILNGIFWTSKFPRLLSADQTEQLAKDSQLRLHTLADVSCDINGSFEFMGESSTIDSPYFMYDPISRKNHDDLEGKGIQIMSIDNLPTEMPLEASEFFSEALYPVVVEMAKDKFHENDILKRAMITNEKGQLVEKHKGLKKAIDIELNKLYVFLI